MAHSFELKALISGVDKLSPSLAGIRKNIAGFRKSLKSSGLGSIGFKSILTGGLVAAPLIKATQAAIAFESAMEGVQHAVRFDTPQQFKQMGRDIARLSQTLPTTANELAAVAVSAAQSGVAREELAAFAETAGKMGLAFGQSATEAGHAMETWRSVYQINQQEVVTLADQITHLSRIAGNAGAKQIAQFVTTLAPVAATAKLAQRDVAALGATLIGAGASEQAAAMASSSLVKALTAGAAASKKQQLAFKALRLDARQLAVGMQHDAHATLMRVLKALSQVEAAKRPAVLKQLFGDDAATFVGLLSSNLTGLAQNLAHVRTPVAQLGALNQSAHERLSTSAHTLHIFTNRASALGLTIGALLLPPMNDLLAKISPLVATIEQYAHAHPGLIKGLILSAAAFGALRLSVAAAIKVSNLALAVWSAAPKVLKLVRIALIGARVAVTLLSSALLANPIGLVLSGIALAAGLVIANWDKVAPVLSGIWKKIKSGAATAWAFLKNMLLQFHPLGLIIKNWEPIVQWFSNLWARIKPYLEPLLNGAKWVSTALGGGDHTVRAPPKLPANTAPSVSKLPVVSTLPTHNTQAATTLARQNAVQAHARTELTVRFEGAPPGVRVESAKTNRNLSVNTHVGYRSDAMRPTASP